MVSAALKSPFEPCGWHVRVLRTVKLESSPIPLSKEPRAREHRRTRGPPTHTGDAGAARGDRAGRGTRLPGDRPGIRRQRDPGPGGPGGGAQAPGHVHRVDGRAGTAPPGVGDRGQLGRRGAGRARRPHRDRAAVRRGGAGRRQRARHPHRHAPGGAEAGGRGRHDGAARRRQVRWRRVCGVRRPARGGVLGRQRALPPARRRGAPAQARMAAEPTASGCPRRRCRWTRRSGRTTPARWSRSGPARTSSTPSTSTSRRCGPASSRWPSSTRA